jgi:hypothetical protein
VPVVVLLHCLSASNFASRLCQLVVFCVWRCIRVSKCICFVVCLLCPKRWFLNRLTGGGNLTPLVPITMQEMKPSVTSSGVLDSSISPYQGNFSRWLSAERREMSSLDLVSRRLRRRRLILRHFCFLITHTRVFFECALSIAHTHKQSFNWPAALFACPLLRLSSHTLLFQNSTHHL